MWQDEGSTAKWSSAHVCRLPEVQAAGQDHKVVCRDGRHPAGIPVVISRSDHLAPLSRIDSDFSTAYMPVINTYDFSSAGWGMGTESSRFSIGFTRNTHDLKTLYGPETIYFLTLVSSQWSP